MTLTPYLDDGDVAIYHGDALDVLGKLEPGSVDAIVTSPPYLDARPEYESPDAQWWDEFFLLCSIRVPGPILLNVGRLFRDGEESDWWMRLRNIARSSGLRHFDTKVWVKPNANPIRGQLFADRHEYILCLGHPDCTFNTDALRVPYAASSIPRLSRGWTNHVGVKNDIRRRAGLRKSAPHPDGGRAISYLVAHTGGEKGNPHPAPMPLAVAEDMVKLASRPKQTALDPFGGSGTTAIAARKLGRRAILIDSSADYCALAAKRLQQLSLLAPESVEEAS